MNDYISRQAAIETIRNLDDYTCTQKAVILGDAMNVIAKLPSADVQPVRRGQWAEENGFIYCPFCGDPWGAPGCESMVKSFNYCPNCGARMDGERK